MTRLYFVGGIFGVVSITTAIFLVPRIGAVIVLFVGLAGQMIASVLIDHFGLIGVARNPINLWKIAGLALIVVGIVCLEQESVLASRQANLAYGPVTTVQAFTDTLMIAEAKARYNDSLRIRQLEIRLAKARIRAVRETRRAEFLANRLAAHEPMSSDGRDAVLARC